MTPIIINTPHGVILHDHDMTANPGDDFFDPDWWREQGLIVGVASGRGRVHFIRHEEHTWALRSYQRGGWAARVTANRYLWLGLGQTRMWREWKLLAELFQRGLPVPRPIATRVVRTGLVYRGELITQLIENAETLEQIIRTRPLPPGDWRVIGSLLARFQSHGVRHDDINVSNVLRDADGGYSLIDFDKAHITAPGAWRAENLARFRRSLEKLRARHRGAHFGHAEWQSLREGYEEPIDLTRASPASTQSSWSPPSTALRPRD